MTLLLSIQSEQKAQKANVNNLQDIVNNITYEEGDYYDEHNDDNETYDDNCSGAGQSILDKNHNVVEDQDNIVVNEHSEPPK